MSPDDQHTKGIPITQPFLPPIEEYKALIDDIWERNWLTNNGRLVKKLEKELKDYLGVPHLNYVSNGTIALQIAIKALGLKGEIITTPFSYVATTSSIVWENCKPVFVDIDPETLNINPDKIEEAITSGTSAILTTHVFGNPCDVAAIDAIAKKNNLKVIYDAAHCFGTMYKGESIYNWGDISIASFHATKLFQTVEGGAVITKDPGLSNRVAYMRNFGHDGPGKFNGVGINGKNSELHAAMGLCNLKYMDEVLSVRRKQCQVYDELIEDVNIKHQAVGTYTEHNHAYYPVIFESEPVLINVKHALEADGIFPRRYFYPSLSTLDYVHTRSTPVTEDISKRILCLPLYHTLQEEDQEKVVKIVRLNTHATEVP